MRFNTCQNCGRYDWACKGECMDSELVKHESGATSSKLELDFHDLPYAGLEAAARRFAYGRKRHGRFNWKQGDASFAEERLKHAITHVARFAENRSQEDLDAILCNFMMIADYRSRGLLSLDPVKDFQMQGKDEPNK